MRNSKAAFVVAAGIILAAGTGASAHRLDELLQAARIGIAEDRVDLELDLTPGAAVADAVIADIDWDRDGAFSAPEQRAFVNRVFSELSLRAGDAPLTLSRPTFTFPGADVLRTGDGVIAIRAQASMPPRHEGAHQLSFDNRYRPERSVYLANALVPVTERIAVTAQHRDGIQSQLRIDYLIRAKPHGALPYLGLTGVLAAVAMVVRWGPTPSRG